MDTTTAQNQIPSNQPSYGSYADTYTPPVTTPPQTITLPATQEPSIASVDSITQQTEPMQPTQPTQPVQPAQSDTPTAPISSTEPQQSSASLSSEELADQNIFEMLGVTTGTPEQREQFLDELQQVIWEDFLENDTKLLLTDVEQAELQKILQATTDKSLEQQEQAVVYLEKLIPDLEDIMLEKALQLKEELVRERLRALRELHRDDAATLAKFDEAERMMSQNKWRAATTALNS